MGKATGGEQHTVQTPVGQDGRWGAELLTVLSDPTAQGPSEGSSEGSYTSPERGTCAALSSEKEKVGRGVYLVTKYAPNGGRMSGEGIFFIFLLVCTSQFTVVTRIKHKEVSNLLSPR